MEYTKGEWKEYRKGLGFDIKANGEVLATVHQVGIDTNSNAHLIAQSPRMYRLLERLVNDGWNANISEEAKEIIGNE